jgi:hypothetical protein
MVYNWEMDPGKKTVQWEILVYLRLRDSPFVKRSKEDPLLAGREYILVTRMASPDEDTIMLKGVPMMGDITNGRRLLRD